VDFRFSALCDDGPRRGGPSEGPGVIGFCIGVSGDGVGQLPYAGHVEVFQLPGREFAEEALHPVLPKSGRQGEMEFHPWRGAGSHDLGLAR